MAPETRYAKSDDVHIAYQVAGAGALDLVVVPGWVSHVEQSWEQPSLAAFYGRLAAFARLILLDRRGTGLSDPVAALPSLEQRMDDVRAVLDAVGSTRAALLGISEGGAICALFAATYPERTSALVLYGAFPKATRTDDWPGGHPAAEIESFLERIEREWGSGITADLFAPSIAQDEHHRQFWARLERHAVSPGGARMLLGMAMDIDFRHVLPAIRVPTLVVHRSGDLVAPVGGARYIAEHVAGAKYVELPGTDHAFWSGDVDALVDEIEEFLTGVRQGPEPDRVLATILFTDIVGATERAAALGDRRWRALLDAHHAVVRREIARFRGREIDTAGDGFFASFDGPARAVRCACAIRDAVATLDLAVRAGVHTGECERIGDDLGGIAVHIGARVAALAQAGEVLVTSTVKDLVAGSGLRFAERGARVLKGVPGEWRLFAVDS